MFERHCCVLDLFLSSTSTKNDIRKSWEFRGCTGASLYRTLAHSSRLINKGGLKHAQIFNEYGR